MKQQWAPAPQTKHIEQQSKQCAIIRIQSPRQMRGAAQESLSSGLRPLYGCRKAKLYTRTTAVAPASKAPGEVHVMPRCRRTTAMRAVRAGLAAPVPGLIIMLSARDHADARSRIVSPEAPHAFLKVGRTKSCRGRHSWHFRMQNSMHGRARGPYGVRAYPPAAAAGVPAPARVAAYHLRHDVSS